MKNNEIELKITEAFQALTQSTLQSLESKSLSLTQEKILRCIYLQEAKTPIALSRLLSLSRATITQHLNYLEASGFLTKRPSRKDRRSLNLRLTRKGEELEDQMAQEAQKTESKLESLFSKSEKENFISCLDRLIKTLA